MARVVVLAAVVAVVCQSVGVVGDVAVCEALAAQIEACHLQSRELVPSSHIVIGSGGHSTVCSASLPSLGPLVIKVPNGMDDKADASSMGVTAEAAPLFDALAQYTPQKHLLTGPVLQQLAGKLRELYAQSHSAESPLRQADSDGDGVLSDEEIVAALANDSGGTEAEEIGADDGADKTEYEWYQELLEHEKACRRAGEAASCIPAAAAVPVSLGQCGNATVSERLRGFQPHLRAATWSARRNAVVQLARYMMALHSVGPQPLVACDLHDANFGIDDDGHVKLVDVDALITAEALHDRLPTSCVDDWQCSFRSSCDGVCEAGYCQRLVPTLATNVHNMCRQFVQWHDDVLPESDAWQTRDNVLQAGVPLDLHTHVRELCRQCTSTAFLHSSDVAVERWVSALESLGGDDEL